jgi:hypothetical protein
MRGAQESARFGGSRESPAMTMRFGSSKEKSSACSMNGIACGKFCRRVREQPQSFFGGLGEIFRPGDGAEFQQRERGDGIARRFRAVVIVLYAQDQILRIGGALPEAAVSASKKFASIASASVNRKVQMFRFQRRFIQINHAGQQKRMASSNCTCRVRRRASGGKAFWILRPTISPDELQIFLRRRAIFFIAQNGGRPRKRAEHQAVPRRENFVVKMRADPFRARGEHF